MNPLRFLTDTPLPGLKRCRVPSDVESVTDRAADEDTSASDIAAEDVERVWERVAALYRTGVYPALQVCVRRRGRVVLHRAVGHARGNSPGAAADAPKTLATTETPFDLFSASKAVSAMVIHKLDELRLLHLEDRVCDFIPEFARHGKHRITLRHVLAHRAGIPNLPPEYLDLDLLNDSERIVEVLCDARLRTRPGRALAYHAVTGGFVLAEVVRRVTGEDMRTVLEKHILEPLGLRWMRYGVKPEDLPLVAPDAVTGPPVPPPLSTMLKSALGMSIEQAVEFSNDPRFLTGIVPSANVVSTASEAAAFYQCLLDGGELRGVRVFEPSTVRHATAEQSYWEIDLTLGLPLRYGLGFMLGSKNMSPFGPDCAQAFGHLGFTNIFTWADPQRQLAVAILTNGKPVLSFHAIRLGQLLVEINRVFTKVDPGEWERGRREAA